MKIERIIIINRRNKMSAKTVRWFFNVSKWEPTHSELLLATSCIQPEEKERIARFVFKKDFKSSLIGRLMMRKFVCEASNVPYNKVLFMRDTNGRPIIDGSCTGDSSTKINFNVSHHGDFVVLAGDVGDKQLGVDVMKLEYTGGKSLSEFFRIMNRNFASSEWDVIKSSGTEQKQISMFCRHWCLKESYVKAIGVGVTINLQNIVFRVATKELKKGDLVCDTELFVDGVEKDFEFQETLVDDCHCVAVALSGKNNCKLGFTELSFDELVKGSVALYEPDEEYCRKYFHKLDKK